MTTLTNPSKRVLFLTNSEYGQAQTQVSIAYELLSYPDIEVHIASFEELGPRIPALNKLFNSRHGKAAAGSIGRQGKQIHFHLIDHPSLAKVLQFKNAGAVSNLSHPPGFWGALRSYPKTVNILLAWEPEEYIAIARRCEDLIGEIRPHAVVVDSLFSAGMDACRRVYGGGGKDVEPGKRKEKPYAILNPLNFCNVLAELQPGKAVWWKFPVISSGFPFPLPLHLVALNILLRLALIFHFVFSLRVLRFARHRIRCGYAGLFPAFDPYWASEMTLSPCIPALSYPMQIPDNVVACGPITIPHADNLADEDPELAKWLRKGKGTILINLGSHAQSSEGNDAVELATAIRLVLSSHPSLQILWKFRGAATTHADRLDNILGPHLRSEQVRIVEWLNVDPAAILASGHVVAMLHHGGANSFFEAAAAGVPQVCLPVWYDTYDFARHVEFLGVGVWGNKKVAPHVGAEEVAGAVLRVVGKGDEQERIRRKARELGEACERAGGRRKAAETVAEMAMGGRGGTSN
ncbi:MAG: hypothetical protein OHK93_001536 [Ramalina farinacea]|uniref:UDP-glucoronosyl and UDP-glucosyl transferase family protein n=1 Tax=Ramalina farinacea TaxID=258253 RepID=A0AA43TSY9_9LECA|nr:hypothetical protein [Ramalina farinacea]